MLSYTTCNFLAPIQFQKISGACPANRNPFKTRQYNAQILRRNNARNYSVPITLKLAHPSPMPANAQVNRQKCRAFLSVLNRPLAQVICMEGGVKPTPAT